MNLNKIIITVIASIPFLVQAQKHRDTTFIRYKTFKGQPDQAIYIDNNRNSHYYKTLQQFSLIPDTGYAQTLSKLVSVHKPSYKSDIPGLAHEWCPLYFYKGKYYVYIPSDFMMNIPVKISNGVFTRYWGDGPIPWIVQHITALKPATYELKLIGEENKKNRVIITLIEAGRGIAVFRYMDEDEANQYQLMVDASKIRLFPIVVNKSYRNEKTDEMKFDQPNFQVLLNSVSKR